jgi:hypothetical protein
MGTSYETDVVAWALEQAAPLRAGELSLCPTTNGRAVAGARSTHAMATNRKTGPAFDSSWRCRSRGYRSDAGVRRRISGH